MHEPQFKQKQLAIKYLRSCGTLYKQIRGLLKCTHACINLYSVAICSVATYFRPTFTTSPIMMYV